MKPLNIGDKVTIYNRAGQLTISDVTQIVNITPRQIHTADGRKWKTSGAFWKEEIGNPNFCIQEYQDGDDVRAAREKRLKAARAFLDLGYDWQIRADLDLLPDADLETLAAITKRINEARTKRKESGEEEAP
jgi:hypothetical protein